MGQRSSISRNPARNRSIHFVVLTIVLALTMALFQPCGGFSWADEVENNSSEIATQDTGDILLATFWESNPNISNHLYISFNGTSFEKLDTAYQDATATSTTNNLSVDQMATGGQTMRDSSIIFYNNYFWMISNWQHDDSNNFFPMIGVSEDGIKWAWPEGQFFNGSSAKYPGIALSPAPQYGRDIVAPDWFVDNNGNIYITFSAGYYGEWHGQPQQDKMEAYAVKVNTLSLNSINYSGGSRWPSINFSAGTATKLNLNVKPSNNRIDGSFFQDEDNTYYMTVKRGGIYNELWKNSSITANGWSYLGDISKSTGYEGPSLTKFNGSYYLYADHLIDYDSNRTTGVGAWSTSNIGNPASFAALGRIATRDSAGGAIPNRHGTVITIKNGSAAYNKIMDIYNNYPKLSRLAGTNRYATMERIVQTGFKSQVDTVFVATGDNFPDALAVSAWAGTKNAPLILTGTATLSAEASRQLSRLNPGNVYIIGSEKSVAAKVSNSIKTLLPSANIQRVSGANRIETALEVYKQGVGSWSKIAIVATGDGFADALSISPFAYANKSPIFLVSNKRISAAALEDISNFEKIIIVGDTNSVDAVSEAQIKEIVGDNIVRLGGKERFGSSSLIAAFISGQQVKDPDVGSRDYSAYPASWGYTPLKFDGLLITSGGNYPDALSGAPLAGTTNSVILLVADGGTGNKTINQNINANNNKTTIKTAYFLGAYNAVSGIRERNVTILFEK